MARIFISPFVCIYLMLASLLSTDLSSNVPSGGREHRTHPQASSFAWREGGKSITRASTKFRFSGPAAPHFVSLHDHRLRATLSCLCLSLVSSKL